jgi:hypothetical protein
MGPHGLLQGWLYLFYFSDRNELCYKRKHDGIEVSEQSSDNVKRKVSYSPNECINKYFCLFAEESLLR